MAAAQIFTKEEIEKVADQAKFQDGLLQGISDGFVSFARGNFFAAPIQTLGAPPMAPFGVNENKTPPGDGYAAQTCVKSGYFRNNPHYVIKVASGGMPWESNSGMMQVYSQTTGRLQALLLDEGILTEWRTAAVGALATRLLWPLTLPSPEAATSTTTCRSNSSSIHRVGMLGTGVQARYQLQMLQRVSDCRLLGLYGRSADKRQVYQEEMSAQGWSVECYEEPDELLRHCDVVITTTPARTPVLGTNISALVGKGDNQDGGGLPHDFKCRLIVCIGADAPGKGELSERLLKLADLLVADHPEQSLERGEFQRLQGANVTPSILPLGKAILEVNDLVLQPERRKRLIIFDSSGVALQDCVVAQMAYETLTSP